MNICFINNYNVRIINFSLSTVVRLVFILLLIIVFLTKNTISKKDYKWLGYILIVVLYFFFHIYNALNFNTYLPNFPLSIKTELFYVIRLILPIIILFLTYKSEVRNKDFNFFVNSTVIFMTLLIIIPNIFRVSISSYGDNIILGNIFDWFNSDYSYIQLASKGFFYSSIVTLIMILLAPYVVNLFLKSRKKFITFLYVIELISLVITNYMVGTKANTYGIILVLLVTTATYVFLTIIRLEKIKIIKTFLLILLIFGAIWLLPFSPAKNRESFDNLTNNLIVESGLKEEEKIEEELKKKNEDIEPEIIIQEYFRKSSALGITPYFLNVSYPYDFDPKFWNSIVSRYSIPERTNNRLIEEQMLLRIKQINNNRFDDYFGITYSRTSQVFNLEKDFIYQYYSLGIFGLILFFGPYIILLLFLLFMVMINFKKTMNITNCSLLTGIGLIFCIAYFSGNTMDNLGITLTVAFVLGYLLKNINNKGD